MQWDEIRKSVRMVTKDTGLDFLVLRLKDELQNEEIRWLSETIQAKYKNAFDRMDFVDKEVRIRIIGSKADRYQWVLDSLGINLQERRMKIHVTLTHRTDEEQQVYSVFRLNHTGVIPIETKIRLRTFLESWFADSKVFLTCESGDGFLDLAPTEKSRATLRDFSLPMIQMVLRHIASIIGDHQWSGNLKYAPTYAR